MNPLDDHELLLWSMRAGLTRAEVRQTMRRGLEAGDLSWPGASETAADRQHRLQAARDYLYDQLLSGYDVYQSKVAGWQGQGVKEDPMAPWQWRNLPSHARARWLSAKHVQRTSRAPSPKTSTATSPILPGCCAPNRNTPSTSTPSGDGAITRWRYHPVLIPGHRGRPDALHLGPVQGHDCIQMLGVYDEQVGFKGGI